MAKGIKTPASVVRAFATEYLKTGNIKATSRTLKIHHMTGWEIAKRLEKDESFVKARAELTARALAKGEMMLQDVMETLAARAKKRPQTIESSTGQMIHIDNAPQYARAMTDAFKALSQREQQLKTKTDLANGAAKLEVVITTKGDEGISIEQAAITAEAPKDPSNV